MSSSDASALCPCKAVTLLILYLHIRDFRILVKPLVMMQSQHEVMTFRFNRTEPSICVGTIDRNYTIATTTTSTITIT